MNRNIWGKIYNGFFNPETEVGVVTLQDTSFLNKVHLQANKPPYLKKVKNHYTALC